MGALMGKNTRWASFTSSQGFEIQFPVSTVEGDNSGPHLVITAGLHGCEYSGIAAAIELYKYLNPAKLKGKIDIVTVASVAAFYEKSPFVNPADKKNPNRTFPGREDGSYTEAQVYFLLNEIIDGCDFYLDLHCGDMIELIEPFAIYHTGAGEEIDTKSSELAFYYGLPSVIPTASDGVWPDRGTSYAAAAELGIPGAIVEAGGNGMIEQQAVDIHLQGLLNVLRLLGMIKGRPYAPDKSVLYKDFKWLYAPVQGIWHQELPLGSALEPGDNLGRIEDLFGTQLITLTSPVAGKLVFTTSAAAMTEGDIVLGIAMS
jgi:predicted deacylase